MSKRNKFNVSANKSKRTCDGIVFDSELEMRYYKEIIKPKHKSGEITSYELQKPYILQEKCKYNGKTISAIKYVADFFIVYKNGDELVVDIKGMADATAKIKRKMFYSKFPSVNYVWITYSKIDGGWCEYDFVQQQRRKRKKEKTELKGE